MNIQSSAEHQPRSGVLFIGQRSFSGFKVNKILHLREIIAFCLIALSITSCANNAKYTPQPSYTGDLQRDFYEAVDWNDLPRVLSSLEQGVDVNHHYGYGNSRFTALGKAAIRGDERIVEVLLDNGADVELQYAPNRRTALWIASEYGHAEIVQLLLNRGANIDYQNSLRYTPLMMASSEGHEGVVGVLLSNGANINIITNSIDGRTALWFAVSRGSEGIVNMLLAKGARTDIPAHFGRTVLLKASESGYEGIVRALLGADANVDYQTPTGESALIIASMFGRQSIVEALLEAGADLNLRIIDTKTGKSSTALEVAGTEVVRGILTEATATQ